MRKKTHNLINTGLSYRASPVKTPRLATVPFCSELLPPNTPPRTPVMSPDSPAARQEERAVVEVASDSDDDKPTSKVNQSHHRST